ncbi:MAG: hypothetical protein ACOY4Q_00610 [Bacillota bacterium]|jgi:hypothetical protein
MARKVVGRFAREMNTESVNYDGPKTRTGARLRSRRTIDKPPGHGVGVHYRTDE